MWCDDSVLTSLYGVLDTHRPKNGKFSKPVTYGEIKEILPDTISIRIFYTRFEMFSIRLMNDVDKPRSSVLCFNYIDENVEQRLYDKLSPDNVNITSISIEYQYDLLDVKPEHYSNEIILFGKSFYQVTREQKRVTCLDINSKGEYSLSYVNQFNTRNSPVYARAKSIPTKFSSFRNHRF